MIIANYRDLWAKDSYIMHNYTDLLLIGCSIALLQAVFKIFVVLNISVLEPLIWCMLESCLNQDER